MLRPLYSLMDRWTGRGAAPRPEALAAIRGLAPAVVVTGASRGIGRALAGRFASAGHGVVLIARNQDEVSEAAAEIARATGVSAVPVALDVTHPDAPLRIDAALAAHGLYMDVLINNAGMGLAGRFDDQAESDLAVLAALNVAVPTRLMHHALGPMLARGRGGVLNVGSLGGFVPGPYQAAYYASKAYLGSLTEAVAHEVRGRGVRVAVLAPGPVETAFHAKMRAESALYRTLMPSLNAETVAARAYRGYMLGQTVIVPGLVPWAFSLALRVLPHIVSVPLVASLLAVEAPERPVPRPAEKAPDPHG
jgi:short-subunit dehydrogenase